MPRIPFTEENQETQGFPMAPDFSKTFPVQATAAPQARDGRALGALAAEGEASFGIYDHAKKYLDDTTSGFLKSLDNDEQREIFSEKIRPLSKSTLNQIARHEAGQRAKVVDSTIEADLQRTLRTTFEAAGDDEAVGELVAAHFQTLTRMMPNRPDVYQDHYVRIVRSQAEGLAEKDPEKAHKMVDSIKDLMGFKEYRDLRQTIDIKEVQTDAMLDPAGTMLKMGASGNDGIFSFYKNLPLDKRLTLLSSIQAQMQHRQTLLKQQKEAAQEELKSQVFDLVAGGRKVEADQNITQWSKERKIDFQTAKTLSDFLRSDSKISDPDVKLATWNKVLFGKISSTGIMGEVVQGNLSTEDAISLMKSKKSIEQNAAQASALRSLTSRTVVDEAKRIIDPGGVLSTPQTKAMMMKFAADYEKASKGQGFDPVGFWNDNGWRYTQGSVPTLWDGSQPKTLDDVTVAKGRLTRSRLPVAKQNIEAEKLQQAEKVLRETERIRNASRNKQSR